MAGRDRVVRQHIREARVTTLWALEDWRFEWTVALERGKVLFGEEFAKQVLDEFDEWDPEFGQLFQTFVYGGMYDRNVIDQKTRELIAVAACVCLGVLPMIRSHGTAALRVGVGLTTMLGRTVPFTERSWFLASKCAFSTPPNTGIPA